MALLEARPYRPFKSSEEYLEAMKEDLAEWLSTLYPELMINAENFMDRLDTGVALCKHANYVRQAAEDYLAKRQARNKSMTRSMTSGLAGPILALGNVYYLPAAKSGTFFARDNVSNFITWCRKSLKIIECLLFETDDLIMRKNEKHVILCLLEVARRGAKFGMLAPMLVQMERQIDREIAADNKANGIGCGTEAPGDGSSKSMDASIQTNVTSIDMVNAITEPDIFDTDSENEDEGCDGPMLMYGPQPQIITNDLKSLDEMVRDLVEKCTCPSQFPMVRVSEGKYRIGDTKVLIFVRILRSHVMVRVGGGWDTLSHYLDKHDPCRCKSQHRSAIAARLIPRNSNQNNGIELHRAQVIFERSPPTARRIISNFNSQATTPTTAITTTTTTMTTTTETPAAAVSHTTNSHNTLLPSFGKQRSRSPTPQRKFLNQVNNTEMATPNAEKQLPTASLLTSPSLARRSMSPSPRRLTDMRKKQSSLDACINSNSNVNSGPKSLPLMVGIGGIGGIGGTSSASVNGIEQPAHSGSSGGGHVQFECLAQEPSSNGNAIAAPASNSAAAAVAAAAGAGASGNGDGNGSSAANKFDNISDNGSEISDEGYRSLGVVQSNAQKRESLHSQASIDDAESNARLDQTSSDSPLSPVDDASNKVPEILDAEFDVHTAAYSTGPQSLPAVLSVPTDAVSGVADDICLVDGKAIVDIASSTGLRRTDFSNKLIGRDGDAAHAAAKQSQRTGSKIPCSPVAQRRRRSSVDSSTCNSGSLQDLSSRSGLPVFNRNKPVYRSVRKSLTDMQHRESASASSSGGKTPMPLPRRQLPAAASSAVRDVTNTWSGRSAATPALANKKRPTINPETFVPPASSPSPSTLLAFERNDKTRSSQILYDSNGRRVRSCTSSLTTSPVKNHAASPLAQQLLEAASSAKNDAQILEKMKALLSRYAASNHSRNSVGAGNNVSTTTTTTQTQTLAKATAPPAAPAAPVAQQTLLAAAASAATTNAAAAAATAAITTTTTIASASTTEAGNNKKSAVYEDFTSAWVHSNGNLERSNSCMPPTTTKAVSKRSSAASSCDSAHSRDLSTVVSPRRERGISKIPAPVRQHTELY